MRDTLTAVRGAVAKKDLVPVLTHFHFYEGRVQGTNGKVSIDAPLAGMPCDLTVPAEKFLKCIDVCNHAPSLTVTPGGQLRIKSGSFRALLSPLPNDSFPKVQPEGKKVTFSNDLVDTLKELEPFISEDASRPWSRGVLFKNGYAYATNNVVLVRKKIDWTGEPINVSAAAIAELARINEPVTGVRATTSSITFQYSGGMWLRAPLVEAEWPDVVSMLDACKWGTLPLLPVGIRDAVEKVLPLCQDSTFPRIELGPKGVCTEAGDHSAIVTLKGLPECAFNGKILSTVLGIAENMDFAKSPAPFTGGGVQGLLVGVRLL